MKSLKRTWFAVAIMIIPSLLAACGGESGNGTIKPPPQQTNKYTVGGTVAGLQAFSTLVLLNNNSNALSLTANAPFSFSTALADGSSYNITVSQQPAGRYCEVNNGSGTIRSANVTNARVVCTTTNAGGVTLSGRIAIPPSVLADSSVNDPNEDYVSNETIGTAQSIPNPVSVGGYVNMPWSGYYGRSFIRGNPDDFYRVQLKAGDVVTLAIGELNTYYNDLDLFLFDVNGNLAAYSIGTGPYEIITAPSTGTYYINVYAYSGASNYVLTIGTDTTAWENAVAGVDILSSQHEIVPDQVVARFKPGAKTAASNQATAHAQYSIAAYMGLTAVAGTPEHEILLTINDLHFQAYVNQTNDAPRKLRQQITVGDPVMARMLNTHLAIKELRKQPDILLAEPNYIVRSFATVPNDPEYGRQWNLPLIGLPDAWDINRGSDDVIVAVVDSGVLMKHPDLENRLTDTGYNFVNDKPGGIGPSPDDPGDKDPDDPVSSSSSYHGTHVAGIIAAETNNSIGMAGVTWETKIMPVRVLGVGGSGSIFDVRDGIRYAAGINNSSGRLPAKPADIINLSLGGPGYSRIDQDLINDVREKGIIVIAAAGNENTSIPSYPASYDGVISVSAVTKNKTRACYSNYGSRIAVAAPGGNSQRCGAGVVKEDSIYSAGGDDSTNTVVFEYNYKAGTSMAAPHVSGVAALMKAVYPGMSPDEFDALLAVGRITDDIGAAGKDEYYGYGLINAKKAIEAAQNLAAGGSITGIGVNPRTINLGVYGSQATITVSKIGTGVISFNDIRSSVNAGWLTVTRNPVVGGESVDYSVNVNRSSSSLHADGVYTAIVTFTDPVSGATASAGITVQVHSAAISYDVGYHYVVLFKVKNDNTIDENAVDQYEVKTTDGYYYYVFYNVPPGRYMIAAGTDRNNDYSIEDWGEVFGAYPTVDQIDVIDVTNKDISDLNFTTNLRYPLRYPQAETTSSSDDNPVAEPPAIKRLR